MSTKKTIKRKLLCLAITLVAIQPGTINAQSSTPAHDNGAAQSTSLKNKATWAPSSTAKISERLTEWSKKNDVPKALKRKLLDSLKGDLADSHDESLDAIVNAIAIVREDVKEFVDLLSKHDRSQIANGSRAQSELVAQLLDRESGDAFLSPHLQLYFARWLAQQKLYDEALVAFDNLKTDDVLDPATLLFYRALTQHQLLKKDACLESTTRLLERSGKLPRRYEVLSKLVAADIKPLKKDSLDEVSRLMSDIERRTSLHRSGQVVLGQEQQVIDKLNKLIEDLEAKQCDQCSPSSTIPSNPMETSQNAGGKGSGEVTSKRQVDGGEWGELPPAERAAALAEMAKDMPPHYREVIEEYFRQLAKDDEE